MGDADAHGSVRQPEPRPSPRRRSSCRAHTAIFRSASREATASGVSAACVTANVGTRPSIVGRPWRRKPSGSPPRKLLAERPLVRRGSPPSRRRRRSRPRRRTRRAARARACPSRSGCRPARRRRGPHLVGPPALEDLGAAERHSEVRPEELVGRADQDVDAELGDVDRCVRREVHGVRPRERARLVSQLGDQSRIDERSDGVRGERERDDPRPLRELRPRGRRGRAWCRRGARRAER